MNDVYWRGKCSECPWSESFSLAWGYWDCAYFKKPMFRVGECSGPKKREGQEAKNIEVGEGMTIRDVVGEMIDAARDFFGSPMDPKDMKPYCKVVSPLRLIALGEEVRHQWKEARKLNEKVNTLEAEVDRLKAQGTTKPRLASSLYRLQRRRQSSPSPQRKIPLIPSACQLVTTNSKVFPQRADKPIVTNGGVA